MIKRPPIKIQVAQNGDDFSSRIEALLIGGLLTIVVFDPSDKITGLKKYFFALIAVYWLFYRFTARRLRPINISAFIIVVLFGFLFPALSICSYYLQGASSANYEGFGVFIGLTSIAFLLIIDSFKLDSVKIFLQVLNIQAFATLLIFIISVLAPEQAYNIKEFGYEKGFLWINDKEFGGWRFLQVFFKTAPFMMLPLAFYCQRLFDPRSQQPRSSLLMAVIVAIALFISGTRANMVFAIIIPIYFALKNLRKLSSVFTIFALLLVSVLMLIVLDNRTIAYAMLDPYEESNSVKLSYFSDYAEIFADPKVLFFGQGIGVVQYFHSLGLELRITEVTPLELIRNFGVLVGAAYFVFWIAPIILLRRVEGREDFHWLWVAYLSYLITSMTNYFILSSTGMILLSIVYHICLSPPTRLTAVRSLDS